MLQIIQDYKDLLNARSNVKQAKKDLDQYSEHPCFDALYNLSSRDLYTSDMAYSLGKDKLTCRNVQKYFGQDAAKCKQCSFFAEYGNLKIKEDKYQQALQKQKEARAKLLADLFLCKTNS